jgi:translation initiation factor 4E binding protein 2
MSASPLARSITSGGQEIPSRRVVITSEEDMPADYSTTPGGTIFGTTPGGTRIVYERAFLINMRNSPMARTPPKNMPYIPGKRRCRFHSVCFFYPERTGIRKDFFRIRSRNLD